MKLPPNTRLVVLNGTAYVEFRKQYKGKTIGEHFGAYDPKTWPRVERQIYALLSEIKAGSYDAEREIRLTVNQAVDLDWEWYGRFMPSYCQFRVSGAVLKRFWNQRYLDTITADDVEDLREEREAEGVLESTVNRDHTYISGLFTRTRKWSARGKIKNEKHTPKERPFQRVKLPQDNPASLVDKTPEEARTRVLSEEEFERLLQRASPRARAVCVAAVKTLLRRKDLRFPKQGNWDPIRHILTGIQHKTGKAFAIPLAAPLPHGLDFTNFRKDFDQAVKEANIRDFVFKDLRRTGARWLLNAGVDLKTISLYLGHKSVQTTERYLGVMPKALINASKILEDKVNQLEQNASELGQKVG